VIEFLEAAHGCAKEISVPKHAPCEVCAGSGAAKGSQPQVCPTCKGQGEVIQQQMFLRIRTTCPACAGAGKVVKDKCPACAGAGRTRIAEKIKVTIPAGVDDGLQIRLSGKGELGDPGGPPGDLYLTLRVKEHERFHRDGLNVLCTVPVSYPMACLGGSITVPTIDGEASVEIPAGTPSGKVFTLRQKGVPALNGRGRGDQLVQVVVAVPTSMTVEETELVRKLAEVQGERLKGREGSFLDGVKEFLGLGS
jgi:molecular chaperone DnaJ